MSSTNIHSALFSVRETFGNSEDAEDEGEGSEDGMSSKSSFSSRFPRPSIEMEYDIDGKTEVMVSWCFLSFILRICSLVYYFSYVQRRNKLRQKSSVNVFHASTQTVDLNPLVVGPSASSRLDKFRKDSTIVETFQIHKRPHALSQPFLGYIRRHEKTYAREIGLMRIALREFKGVYDHIKFHLDSLMNNTSPGDASPAFLKSLHHMQMLLHDGNWVFDPKFFLRKVQMNPLEDPIDVSAQAEMINSYNTALVQNDAELKQAQDSDNTEEATVLAEVKDEMQNLITDLTTRVKEKGGWRALLYTATGGVDLTMNLKPWSPEEQVLILQEKLRFVQLKSTEQEAEHEKVMKHLQDALQQAHTKDHNHSFHKSKFSHPHSAHSQGTPSKHSSQRSHSVSGASSVKPAASKALNNSNHSAEPQTAALATSPRRHSSAVTGDSHPHDPSLHAAPSSTSAHQTAQEPAHAPHDAGPVTHSTLTGATLETEPSVDDLMQNMPSLDAYRDLPPSSSSPARRMPAAMEGHLRQVVGTLGAVRSALESSQRTQETQKRYIEQLEQQLRLARMSDDLSDTHLPSASGALDGENSMMSHASNEILDEYQQIGAHHNSFNNSFSGAPGRAGIAHGGDTTLPMHNLTSQLVAAGTVGISANGARRGSTLVMHRDRGEGRQIEYVPVGKMVTNQQALRITVNNEQRDHRHLLVRPSSAAAAQQVKKSFASIMGATSTTAVGGKGPVDKFRQLEIQHRRDQAMQVLQTSKSISSPNMVRAGLFPLAGSSPDMSLPVPKMRPPSPQQLSRMSDKALIHELSTIMDSRGNSPNSSPKRLSPQASGVRKSPQPHQSRAHSPSMLAAPTDNGAGASTEALLKTLQELCQNLQEGLTTAPHAVKEPQSPQSKFAEQNGLQIGEAAIEQERREEKHARRRPESHHTLSQTSSSHNQRDTARPRPKTAGDASTTMSGDEASSYEDLFGELIHSQTTPSATHMHSDVSIYAMTLQNRYLHHLEEAKKIEVAIKRLGRANEEELEDQQEMARSHYVSRDVFRPKSAAPPATQYLPGISAHDNNRVTVSKSPGATTQRAFSASSARPVALSGLHLGAKAPSSASRSATAAPFPKSKQPRERLHQHVLVGALPHVGLDAGSVTSVTSPRLHESSAELSNLSEHDLPMFGRRKI